MRCTSSAAIAPGQMDMFFGDQTGIDIPRKCIFFPRVLFSNVCLMTATRIEDHKNAQVKADVHEHIHQPVEKSCCATWTAKTVDSQMDISVINHFKHLKL